MMLHGCCKDDVRMMQGCCKDAARILQGCCKDTARHCFSESNCLNRVTNNDNCLKLSFHISVAVAKKRRFIKLEKKAMQSNYNCSSFLGLSNELIKKK